MITRARKMLTPVKILVMHAAMRTKPQSLRALCGLADLSMPVVTRFIRQMQDANALHIGAWARDARGYPTIEQYMWGKGVDAVCPIKNESSAVRMAALRAKRKATK